MKRLVIGCGYLGSRVARIWSRRGDTVHAVTRSPERAARFRAKGWTPLVADINDLGTLERQLAEIPSLDTVLFAVGYDRGSGRSIHEVYVAGLDKTLAALAPHLPTIRSFVYISSTGVYGQLDGAWVTEDAPCQPTRAGGIACRDAEGLLRQGPFASRAIILRCAGIYGPGRVPHREALIQGTPLMVARDGYLNLVHVEDAARIAARAADELPPPRLLNVTDGHPARRGDYYATLARLLDAPPPRFADPDETAFATRAGGAADKRVSNERLRESLDHDWLFPDYQSGLASIVAGVDDVEAIERDGLGARVDSVG